MTGLMGKSDRGSCAESSPEEESTGVVRGRLARGKSPGEDMK